MTKRAKSILVVVAIAGAVLPGTPAWSAPGELDPTFGNEPWIATTEFDAYDDVGLAVLIQPDGMLVTAGGAGTPGPSVEFALARNESDGSLDPSFGTGGKVTTPIGFGGLAEALVLQPDGKLVAAGWGHNGVDFDFALVRYNSDGSLDSSFDTDGKVMTSIAFDDHAYALVRQPDGKLVAAGYGGGGNADFALVRYNSNGSLDLSFDTDGKVTTPIGTAYDRAFALVLQPDGKLVAAGLSYNGSDTDFALVRYNSTGSLDLSFGTGGKVTTPIGTGNDAALSLVLQSDGKLVAAGYSYNGSNSDFALVRYNGNDGSLDPSFGTGGKVTTPIGAGSDVVNALLQQPDGKLVAAGESYNGSTVDFALVRYDSTGSLDPSFGTGGKLTTPIAGTDGVEALALQSDGKLVAAGRSEGAFVLVRYDSDGTIDTGYTPGITSTPDTFSYALALQADGKLLSAGSEAVAAVTRYLSDGSIDTAFGVDGIASADFGVSSQFFLDVTQLSDGRIAAAGELYAGSIEDFVVARFLADGMLDPSFGSGGKVVTDFGQSDFAVEVLEQPGDALLVIGSSLNTPSFGDFALARYTGSGAPDPSFDGDGKVTTDFSFGVDIAEAALVQDDGKIVVVGRTGAFGSMSVAVARYESNGALDATFGTGGRVTATLLSEHDSADLVQLPDGKLVVSTTAYDGTPHAGMLQLNTDGSLDTNFGVGGKVIGPVGYFVSLVREDSGKLVVAGTTDDFAEPAVSGLAYKFARFDADGSLDGSFGSGGVAYVMVDGETFSDLVAQPDGRLLLSGDDYSVNGTAIVRLQSSFCHDADPAASCGAPGKSLLQWKQGPDPTVHKLVYKWLRGEQTDVADLADPTDTSTYSLCVFDDDGQALHASVPPAGTCEGLPCWKATASGYSYKDNPGSNSGIRKVALKAGSAGKAKMLVKGMGENLPDGDGQPLSGDVTAVLVNEDTGICVASSFTGAEIITNDGTQLKAKAP